MASKFMAFESVASTSAATPATTQITYNEENERIEMNVNQFPNYQSNQNQPTPIETGPYGAVDEDDDLNENFEEKSNKNVGYRQFIYNNSEQFKSICGGLLLLMGSGIHIVWGIYRIFNLYVCEEENSFYLRFVIWSWYLGAIIGSSAAGYVIATIRKSHIYFTGGALLIVSGIFLGLSEAETNIYLLTSRIIGGITHGIVYVSVIVQASENATKEFREFLMLIFGGVMNYSILISVLAFFHTEGLFSTGLLNGLGLFSFGLCTMIVTSKHGTETPVFILQNNGSELDALQTMSKLKKKPIAARSVHHDFLILKNHVQDEMDYYGKAEFRKVLLPENRKSFVFCCYGRLCSVLSFNLPLIVMIMLFLREWADESVRTHDLFIDNQCHPELSAKHSYINHLVGVERPSDAEDEIEIEQPVLTMSRSKRELSQKSEQIEKPKSAQEDEKSKEKDKEKVIEENDKKLNKNDENKVKDEHDKENVSKIKSKEKETNKDEMQKIEKEENKLEKQHESKEHNERNEKHRYKEHEKSHGKEGIKEKSAPRQEKGEKLEKNEKERLLDENKKSETEPISSPKIREKTFFAHLIIFLHSRELTLVLLAWFIFGTLTVCILYTLNLKRFIYYVTCVLSSTLAITGVAHSFHLLSGILHFCLIVYFNYVTIPIDVFGHCMLAEAFPITLKAFSIAAVAIVEHTVHILVIGLYMSEWFHDSIIMLFMGIVAFIAHEIARNLPQKSNLSLAEAREEYQHIDLMLFSEPKIGYNQQQQQQQQQQDFI